MKKHYCKEKNCKNEISEWNHNYGMGFCKSCAHSGERNHFSFDDYSGEKNHRWQGGWKSFCVDCGKKIDFNAKRCQKHAKIHQYKNPENHPQYIDGRSKEPYSLDFTQSLKELIRKRDNYTCQNCNMTEEEHIIVLGKVLHVHHIDYNKENCNEDNLITVCASCNTRANFNREYWKEIYNTKIKEISHDRHNK